LVFNSLETEPARNSEITAGVNPGQPWSKASTRAEEKAVDANPTLCIHGQVMKKASVALGK